MTRMIQQRSYVEALDHMQEKKAVDFVLKYIIHYKIRKSHRIYISTMVESRSEIKSTFA